MAKKRSIDMDIALDALPLSPTPPGFTQRTLQRVRQMEAERAYGRLRFEDLVLPAFMALFLLLLMVPGVLAAYVWLNADSLWAQRMLLELHYRALRLTTGMNMVALVWVALATLATILLSGMLGLWAWGSALPRTRRI